MKIRMYLKLHLSPFASLVRNPKYVFFVIEIRNETNTYISKESSASVGVQFFSIRTRAQKTPLRI